MHTSGTIFHFAVQTTRKKITLFFLVYREENINSCAGIVLCSLYKISHVRPQNNFRRQHEKSQFVIEQIHSITLFSVYRPCICLYIYITSLHIEGYSLYMYQMNIYILVNKTLLQYFNTATLNC